MAVLNLTEARIRELSMGSGIHRDEQVKGLMVIPASDDERRFAVFEADPEARAKLAPTPALLNPSMARRSAGTSSPDWTRRSGAAAAVATFAAVEAYGAMASLDQGTNYVPNDMVA